MTRRLLALPASAAVLALAACGSGGSGTSTGTGAAAGGDGRTDVVVSFYPLEWATQQIGGDRVQVTNLTKPGEEPHDLELKPQDVATTSKADLAVYLKDFQPTVDEAVKPLGDKAFDVSAAADLSLAAAEDGHDHGDEHGHEGESAEEHADHASEPATPGAEQHGGHDHGSQDPHFWLDPQRYAKVADAIAARLGEADPAHKAEFTKNAADLKARLTTLDKDFAAGLKPCTNKHLVTSHAAFGYLADRYGFHQDAISGLSPEEEPEPAKLAEVAKKVKASKTTTIYAETLVSPAIAETVARETGAQVAVLDPIEGITDKSAGNDYLEVMASNLATLKKGQSCQ